MPLGSRLLWITVEPLLQLTPVCSCISFLSFSSHLPSHLLTCLCSDITKAELNSRYQQCNSRLLRNYCSCFPPRVQLQRMWRHGLGKSLCHCQAPCLFCVEKRASVCVDVSLIYFTVTSFIHPFFVLHSKAHSSCVCNAASDGREN